MKEETNIKKPKNTKGTGIRLIKDLMKQKWKLFIVLISIVAASIFNVLAPTVVGDAINIIFNGIQNALQSGNAFNINIETMGRTIGILLLLYLLSSLFTYIQQYIMASVAQSLTLSLRNKVSTKLNSLPISFFDTYKRGDIMSRVTSDLERVSDTLQEGLTQLFSSIIGVIGAFTMMLLISPSLTIIVSVAVIGSLIVTLLFSKKTQEANSANQEALGNLNGSIEEYFTGNSIVKAFNLEKMVVQNTDELNDKLFDTGRKTQFLTFVINPIIRLINQFGYVIIAVRGGIAVFNGTMTIGGIQAFFQYVNQVSEPITQVSYIFNMLQGAIASVERVYEVIDQEDEQVTLNPVSLPEHGKGSVRFENVRFGYSKDDILMDNINIDIKPGEKVAIVGPTGAGKTTLINLLMRFYEIFDGTIYVDGVDITKLTRNDLRSRIGMVLQDTWLFTGSIKDNINYGNKNASFDDVVQAAKAARVDYFIRTLPNGYDTILESEVSGISQGQKQLLTIARALLANPQILILDEATSSVDTRTEIEIQKAMNHLMKGRTSFIIAHRLSTIRDADHILVMNKGTIIEQGNHEQLMEQGQFYANLYNSQFAGNE